MIVTQTESTTWLALDRLKTHPQNLAAWSDKYQARVADEQVETLRTAIAAEGFDPKFALLVRPIRDETGLYYQIVEGNHRYVAVCLLFEETGDEIYASIPVVVREMSDSKAYLLLLTRQSRTIPTWYKARHAFNYTSNWGSRNSEQETITEYSRLVGIEQSTITRYRHAYIVHDYLKRELIDKASLSSQDMHRAYLTNNLANVLNVKTSFQIHTLPQEDWLWFGEMVLKEKAGGERVAKAIATVKEISIPNELSGWLDLKHWKSKAAYEIIYMGDTDVPEVLELSIKTAMQILDKLPSDQKVLRIEKRTVVEEVWDLKAKFLRKLIRELPTPSRRKTDIDMVVKRLLNEVQDHQDRYNAFMERLRLEALKQSVQEDPTDEPEHEEIEETVPETEEDDEIEQYEIEQQEAILEMLRVQEYAETIYEFAIPDNAAQFSSIITEIPPELIDSDELFGWYASAMSLMQDNGCIVAIVPTIDAVLILKNALSIAGMNYVKTVVLSELPRNILDLDAGDCSFGVISGMSNYIDVDVRESISRFPLYQQLVVNYCSGRLLEPHGKSQIFLAAEKAQKPVTALNCHE